MDAIVRDVTGQIMTGPRTKPPFAHRPLKVGFGQDCRSTAFPLLSKPTSRHGDDASR